MRLLTSSSPTPVSPLAGSLPLQAILRSLSALNILLSRHGRPGPHAPSAPSQVASPAMLRGFASAPVGGTDQNSSGTHRTEALFTCMCGAVPGSSLPSARLVRTVGIAAIMNAESGQSFSQECTSTKRGDGELTHLLRLPH